MKGLKLKIGKLSSKIKGLFSKFKFSNPLKKESKEIQKRQDFDMKLVQNLNKSRFPKIKQLKYYRKIFPKKELWILRSLVAIILLSTIWIGYDLYHRNSEIIPDEGGEYVEAFVGKISTINPILAANSSADMAIVKLVFSGLMKYNENLELIPDLAETYDISEDQMTYTFKLREGVKWQDYEQSQESVDASDVVYTIETIQNPKFKSPFLQSFKGG